jgi:predicted transcriptional regulator
MKTILCVKVEPELKEWLRELSLKKDRSMSYLVNTTLFDMKTYQERKKDENLR